jgi:hypothetical protein
MFKIKLIYISCFIFLIQTLHAQNLIGVGLANESAKLTLNSTTKGFLPPRLTYTQKLSISNPPIGAQIWCTNCGSTGEMQVFNNIQWTHISGAAAANALADVSTTISVSAISYNVATSGGSISNDGGSNITAKGICWSTATNPTIALSTKTNDGTGTTTFSSSLINLLPITTYYLRAYATNAVGTSYGPEISFTTTSVAIGNAFQGGKVAYIYSATDPGYVVGQQHGFIMATENQALSPGKEWSNAYEATGAIGIILGTGLSNTNILVTRYGLSTTYAAGAARSYAGGGYSDWFLPSKDELNKLIALRSVISVSAGGLTDSEYYWSSTEIDSDYAWRQINTNSGLQNQSAKVAPEFVRAIRYF